MGADVSRTGNARQRQQALAGIERRRNQIRTEGEGINRGVPEQPGAAGIPGMPPTPSRLEMQERTAPSFAQQTPLETSAPEFAPGITLGPGRARRMPDQGSPEYEQLAARVRGLRNRV